jgi:anaerobic C4-dicarboxylate transporter
MASSAASIRTMIKVVWGGLMMALKHARISAMRLIMLDALTLPTGLFGWLFVRRISQFAGSMEDKVSDDPVYKKNLQRLIERNREFEEAKNEPRS